MMVFNRGEITHVQFCWIIGAEHPQKSKQQL